MLFRFAVGQNVEFQAPSSKQVGLYRIIRHMPVEYPAMDLKYRIKSVYEHGEWNVLESQLSSPSRDEFSYTPLKARPGAG